MFYAFNMSHHELLIHLPSSNKMDGYLQEKITEKVKSDGKKIIKNSISSANQILSFTCVGKISEGTIKSLVSGLLGSDVFVSTFYESFGVIEYTVVKVDYRTCWEKSMKSIMQNAIEKSINSPVKVSNNGLFLLLPRNQEKKEIIDLLQSESSFSVRFAGGDIKMKDQKGKEVNVSKPFLTHSLYFPLLESLFLKDNRLFIKLSENAMENLNKMSKLHKYSYVSFEINGIVYGTFPLKKQIFQKEMELGQVSLKADEVNKLNKRIKMGIDFSMKVEEVNNLQSSFNEKILFIIEIFFIISSALYLLFKKKYRVLMSLLVGFSLIFYSFGLNWFFVQSSIFLCILHIFLSFFKNNFKANIFAIFCALSFWMISSFVGIRLFVPLNGTVIGFSVYFLSSIFINFFSKKK